MSENLLKTRKATGTFAIIALLGGFIFLNKSITGNIIINEYHSISAFSIIGLLLFLCAIILTAYTIKRN